jgi:sugar/nucleoside kinase (ribokinase family)
VARRLRVLVAGHVCVDLIPELRSSVPRPGTLVEVGPVAIQVGGCVANTGLALARLAGSVRLLTIVGTDILGDIVVQALASADVKSSSVQRTSGEGTSYSVVLEAPGDDRAFLHHVGANAAFDPDLVELDGIDLLHVGYPQLLPRLTRDGGRRFTALLDRAKRSGVTTSVDFATLDSAAASRLPWPELLRRWAPFIDILTPSVDDLRPILGDRPGETPTELAAVAAELVEAGVGCALVTAGRLGMALQTAHGARLDGAGRSMNAVRAAWTRRQLACPAPAVDVVRTTGAGDVATAGFLAGLLAGMNPEGALRLAAGAAGAHISGLDPLPRSAHAYQSIPLRAGDSAGWTVDELGVQHGPADGSVR